MDYLVLLAQMVYQVYRVLKDIQVDLSYKRINLSK
jgi:hypothetical protein